MGKLSAGKLCRFSPQFWSFSFRFVLELRAIEIDPTDPPKVTDVTATERRISSAKRSPCSTRPSLTRFRRGMRRLTGNMGVKKCTRLNWWAFLHRIFGKIHLIRVFALPFWSKSWISVRDSWLTERKSCWLNAVRRLSEKRAQTIVFFSLSNSSNKKRLTIYHK